MNLQIRDEIDRKKDAALVDTSKPAARDLRSGFL